MGKTSREKGKRGERRAVKLLQPVYPDARRSANQSDGAHDPDVKKTPFWLESKEQLRPNVWAAVEQAVRDREAAGDTRPVLCLIKRTRGPYIAVMLAEEFVEELLKR